MCSGLLISSVKGAIASRAASALGEWTSRRTSDSGQSGHFQECKTSSFGRIGIVQRIRPMIDFSPAYSNSSRQKYYVNDSHEPIITWEKLPDDFPRDDPVDNNPATPRGSFDREPGTGRTHSSMLWH